MKKILVLATLLLSVSLGFGKRKPDIDNYTLVDTTGLKEANTAYILPFDVVKSEELTQSTAEYGKLFAQILMNTLTMNEIFSEVILVKSEDEIPAEQDSSLIIHGVIDELDGGNRAARFWVGFGAGSSWCEATLNFFSRNNNELIGTFNHRKGSAMGMKTEEVLENVLEVVTEICEVVQYEKNYTKKSRRD